MPRIFFRQRLLQPVNPFSDFEAKLVDLLDLKSCNSIKRSFFFSQRQPTKGTKEDSLAKILSKMDPCSAFSGRNEKETKTREKVFWLKTFRFTFASVSPKRCSSDYLLLWREKESSASITKTHCPRWPIGWRWATHPLFSSIFLPQTVRFLRCIIWVRGHCITRTTYWYRYTDTDCIELSYYVKCRPFK